MTTRYSQPSRVQRHVMSDTQAGFGAATVYCVSFFVISCPHAEPVKSPPQTRKLCPLVSRERAAGPAPRIALGLRDPAPERGLGQIELTRHRAGTLPTLLHHLDRFRLELRRERSPPPLLPHDPLLSHFPCGSECLRNPGKPKPGAEAAMPGAGLTAEVVGKARPDRLALKS